MSAIAFAEKILELLDEGRYTATYKYAVLLTLMDLCLEQADRSGRPPEAVTTRQLAERIVELYWPHTVPYGDRGPATVLKQNVGGQAEIVSAIASFRQRWAPTAAVVWQARRDAPDRFETLVRLVEWKLIQMPLPRLQTVGAAADQFIYTIHWTQDGVRKKDVTAYQKGDPSEFDNRIVLRPHVAEYLRDLNGLLRPLIHRKWAAMVAALNQLTDARLEAFLFGHDRVDTTRIRGPLWELQGRRCFYCEARIPDPSRGAVDHFIPWARYPDDGLDNLVVADARCNGWKSASLAAADHVARWGRRFVPDTSLSRQLADLARTERWLRDRDRTLRVSRSIYLALPDTARLWLREKQFVGLDRPAIAEALAAAP